MDPRSLLRNATVLTKLRLVFGIVCNIAWLTRARVLLPDVMFGCNLRLCQCHRVRKVSSASATPSIRLDST
jgi:hypothetical protein